MKFIMIVLTKKNTTKLTEKQKSIKFFYVLYSIFVSWIGVVPIKNHKRDKSMFRNHFLQKKIQKTISTLYINRIKCGPTRCTCKKLNRKVRGYFIAVIAHVVTKL